MFLQFPLLTSLPRSNTQIPVHRLPERTISDHGTHWSPHLSILCHGTSCTEC